MPSFVVQIIILITDRLVFHLLPFDLRIVLILNPVSIFLRHHLLYMTVGFSGDNVVGRYRFLYYVL